jgi:hypothetical protein
MRTMTRTLPGLALVLAVSVAGAQQPSSAYQEVPNPKAPTPKKSALEEALEQALKHNPDLRVAESKLVLAEAELSRTRRQITQKVAAAYADVIAERAVVAEVERQSARVRELHKAGTASAEELSKAEVHLSERKAKLAAAQREFDHLQGKAGRAEKQTLGVLRSYQMGDLVTPIIIGSDTGSRADDPTVQRYRQWLRAQRPEITGSDKLRQALQKKVTASGKQMALSDYLAMVRKTAGVSIQADTKGAAWKEAVDFDFDGVTVGAMLQFLEDILANHQIVVREYGLLVMVKEKVPERAVSLAAFLAAGAEKPKGNFTGERVEGKILKVDGKGLCAINIGTKAGLANGHRLEVYRSAPTPKYLGVIHVIEARAESAICKTADKMHGNVMEGDLVTTRLSEK